LAFIGCLKRCPRKAELFFAIGSFVATYWLVRKRRSLFPVWLLNIVIGIVGLLSFIDLAFGYAVTHLFDYATSWIERVVGK